MALHFVGVEVDWSAVVSDCGISWYYLLMFRNMNVAYNVVCTVSKSFRSACAYVRSE